MPTYEYACTSCGEHLEVVQSFSDEPLATCPNCGSPLRKVFGSIGIVLKGSGFYKTDNRTARNGSKSAKSEGSTSESSSTSSSSGSSGGSSGPSGSSGSDSGSGSGSSSGSSAGSSAPAAKAAAS